MHTNGYYEHTKTGEVSARGKGKRFKEGMTFEIEFSSNGNKVKSIPG